MTSPYRTLFVGTLVQESFLSVGGVDDPNTTVDSPFCRDGRGRPTLRGAGLAGALIATLRRHLGSTVPETISGSKNGRQPSVWRFFNSHPTEERRSAYRQHVAIDERTGAAARGALFNVETLPPGTRWPFLLEVDTARDPQATDLAREALSHWAAGRCLLGREVARGLGWMRLKGLREYPLTVEDCDAWPCTKVADRYPAYIRRRFSSLAKSVPAADKSPLPGWLELTGSVSAGMHDEGYGIDSLSIGGHASEELAAAWNQRFLAPDGLKDPKEAFDPDFAIVTFEQKDKHQQVMRLPYIPGSSLRGPLRHALARLLRARGEKDLALVESLFGSDRQTLKLLKSAKLLIRDALPDDGPVQLAWMQHHAEDEFAGGAYSAAKFDRVAVMQGRFLWRMVVEDASVAEKAALRELFALAWAGQLGIGGGQWRGHGWLNWQFNEPAWQEDPK
ncbi:MAG: RAMP superfamily CRISPR-associated protein [Candidatus Competibacter sp.]|nr:RAMP superfamily CRISPR-associated protein [Candidatus Competibacter sp.]